MLRHDLVARCRRRIPDRRRDHSGLDDRDTHSIGRELRPKRASQPDDAVLRRVVGAEHGAGEATADRPDEDDAGIAVLRGGREA